MLRIYAAMAQTEHELISDRTKAALRGAKARGMVRGGDRGYWPAAGPVAAVAALARRLTERGVSTPRGSTRWAHTIADRVLDRAIPGAQT